MSGRNNNRNNRRKSSRRLDFNGNNTFESETKKNRKNDRRQFEKFHEDFIERNGNQDFNVTGLPQPHFYSESILTTPVRQEEKVEVLSTIPDGVFFIKGKTGVEMFRQMLATAGSTSSKSTVDTPDAPKKNKRRDSF